MLLSYNVHKGRATSAGHGVLKQHREHRQSFALSSRALRRFVFGSFIWLFCRRALKIQRKNLPHGITLAHCSTKTTTMALYFSDVPPQFRTCAKDSTIIPMHTPHCRHDLQDFRAACFAFRLKIPRNTSLVLVWTHLA